MNPIFTSVVAGSAILAVAPSAFAKPVDPEKPNFIYVFCDDLGVGDISCYNPQSKIKTPNIDALAARGMLFTDAHVSAALCSPSRYNILTGRYRWRTPMKSRVNSAFSTPLINQGRLTSASVLKRAGYRTEMIGKWHVGMTWQKKNAAGASQPHNEYNESKDRSFFLNCDFSKPVSDGPCDVGFDHFFGLAASADMGPFVFIQDSMPTAIPNAYIAPRSSRDKRTNYEIRARGCSSPTNLNWASAPGWSHEAVPAIFQGKVMNFLKDAAKSDSPFFLHYTHTGPHSPVLPSAKFKGKSKCGDYGDFVMEIDAQVGAIVTFLKKEGIYDNTVIVFSSDNGPESNTTFYPAAYGHNSTAGFRGHKRDNWDGGNRVPMIVCWPNRVKAKTRSDAIVEVGDFMATVAEITGQTLPDSAGEDSFSFLPLLLQTKDTVREFVIHEANSGVLAIRDAEWKLMLHSGSGGNVNASTPPVSLYNMKTDKFEQKNVYQAHPDVVKRLYDKAVEVIANGRSTPGAPQDMGNLANYKQYQDILKLPSKNIY